MSLLGVRWGFRIPRNLGGQLLLAHLNLDELQVWCGIFFQLTKDNKYSELFLIDCLKRDWLSTVYIPRYAELQELYIGQIPYAKISLKCMGVSGYLKLGGQLVMQSAPAAWRAIYSAKDWVSNCPPCPPATYAPEIYHCQQAGPSTSVHYFRDHSNIT